MGPDNLFCSSPVARLNKRVSDIAMTKMSVRLHPFQRWLASMVFVAVLAVPAAANAQVVVIANGSPITSYDIEQRTKLIATSTHKEPRAARKSSTN